MRYIFVLCLAGCSGSSSDEGEPGTAGLLAEERLIAGAWEKPADGSGCGQVFVFNEAHYQLFVVCADESDSWRESGTFRVEPDGWMVFTPGSACDDPWSWERDSVFYDDMLEIAGETFERRSEELPLPSVAEGC
jgi:hypothetical protein